MGHALRILPRGDLLTGHSKAIKHLLDLKGRDRHKLNVAVAIYRTAEVLPEIKVG